MQISSAESIVYFLISTQHIKIEIKQQNRLLLGASGWCLNLQSDVLEILLLGMTVSLYSL